MFRVPDGIDPKVRKVLQDVQGIMHKLYMRPSVVMSGCPQTQYVPISTNESEDTRDTSSIGDTYGDTYIHGDLFVDGIIDSGDIHVSLSDITDVGTVAYDAYKVLVADGSSEYDARYLDRIIDPTGAANVSIGISGSDTVVTGSYGDLYWRQASNDYFFQTASGSDIFEISGSGSYVKSYGTIKTSMDVEWDMGGYSAGAPTATGYLSVRVGGVNYRILTATTVTQTIDDESGVAIDDEGGTDIHAEG